MKNIYKYLSGVFFLLSGSFYFLIIFNIGNEDVEYSNDIFEVVHQLNYIIVFPILMTMIFMYFFRKKRTIDLMDYFTSWILFAFFTIVITFISTLEWGYFYQDNKVYFIHNTTEQKIIERENFGTAVTGGWKEVSIKSKHLLIFNKYEEIDTNTLDLSQWKKVK